MASMENGGAVYWVGQDGNIWLKDGSGTRNMGRADAGASDTSWRSYREGMGNLSGSATRISDPLAPAPTQEPASSGSNVADTTAPVSRPAPAAPAPVLDEAALANTDKAIASLDTERAIGYKNVDDSFGSLIGKYDNEATRAKGDYDEGVTTNNNNLSRNRQNSLLAAAQGRRGLRGTLAAIGALGGDGAKLADRAVTEGANDDLGESAETFAGNAANLDKAKGRFEEEDKERRAEAETARNNQKTKLDGSIASKRQQFFQKKADIYKAGGRNDDATNWMNQAGDLNNEIATKSAVAATPFTARGAAFTPGALESYLAGAGDMTVSVAGANAGKRPSTVLAGRRAGTPREEEEERLVAA